MTALRNKNVTKFDAISGTKINSFTFLQETPPRIRPNGRKERRVDVQCDCGKVINVRFHRFFREKSPKCCDDCKDTTKVGSSVDKLTIVESLETPKNSRARIVVVKCECGEIFRVTVKWLNTPSQKKKQCLNCSKKAYPKLKTGWKSGDITILGGVKGDESLPYHQRRSRFLCVCGREDIATNVSLSRNTDQKCRHQIFSGQESIQVGSVFGHLTVVELLKDKKEQKTVAVCKCTCGSAYRMRASNLVRGQHLNCGCLPKFSGEIPLSYYTSVVRGAVSRKLEISITKEDIEDLFVKQKRTCALTGVKIWFFDPLTKKRTQTASLDRIDSNLGYIPGNVQWIHKDLNLMKNCFTEEKFMFWCLMAAEHYNRKEGTK